MTKQYFICLIMGMRVFLIVIESGNEAGLVSDKSCVDLWLNLNGVSFTQESTQVTQSRRGYMQESSGSA